jgi:hypothetical protein
MAFEWERGVQAKTKLKDGNVVIYRCTSAFRSPVLRIRRRVVATRQHCGKDEHSETPARLSYVFAKYDCRCTLTVTQQPPDILCNAAWSGSYIHACLHCWSPSSRDILQQKHVWYGKIFTCIGILLWSKKEVLLYYNQQLIGSEFCTNFSALAVLGMCHFLRSIYCHISAGNLQTLSVKGIIQFGVSDEGG